MVIGHNRGSLFRLTEDPIIFYTIINAVISAEIKSCLSSEEDVPAAALEELQLVHLAPEPGGALGGGQVLQLLLGRIPLQSGV